MKIIKIVIASVLERECCFKTDLKNFKACITVVQQDLRKDHYT